MTAIVEVSGLTKTYKGGFQALKGVDLAIEEGEILALLGPNGAGKTTLISALCGIVQPTGGTARVGVTVDGALIRLVDVSCPRVIMEVGRGE